MARSLLIHAALAAAALALRLQRREGKEAALRAVPEIREFRELWGRRYRLERHREDIMEPSIQLVLGVFTVAPDVEYRQVVRKTWFNQTGVCYLQKKPKFGCSVYVAFVVGNIGMGVRGRHGIAMTLEKAEETREEEGMFVLNTSENLNGDKSQMWFDTVRRRFPWATHVGKSDMDTYPFLHKLVHRMAAGRPCSRQQSPYEVIGRPHSAWAMPPFSRVCGGSPCGQFVSGADNNLPVAMPGQPWRFLSGELYVLSMPLVQQVNWTSRFRGTEDLQVALHWGQAAQEKSFCVVLRRLDAWYHRSAEYDSRYANDLSP